MSNAAIVVFKRNALPKVLNFIIKPSICQSIEVGDVENKHLVYIIECPVTKEYERNRKIANCLKRLCLENNITYFIGKNIEYYLGSGLEYLEYSIDRGTIDEVKAIKDLAALIKLSEDKAINLLKKNMCFIGESHSYQYISTMLIEAAGVFIYEKDKTSVSSKKLIFEQLMVDKGISAAITNNLDGAIAQCDIIFSDTSVELEEYKSVLSGKILIGANAVFGNFEKIDKVLLWYDSMEGLVEDNILIGFNDELLAVLRHFHKEKGPIDFIRKFPYIYKEEQV